MKSKNHKNRIEKLREIKSRSHIKSIPNIDYINPHLDGETNSQFIASSNIASHYYTKIDNFDLSVSKQEINKLLDSLDKEASADNILEPVFLGLLDGTMRAFKIGTKQGVTASRLYKECQNFSYEYDSNKTTIDSYTENLNERANITEFDKRSSYSNGSLTRDGESLNVRDNNAMTSAKEDYFNGDTTATDEYDPSSEIFKSKSHAKSKGKQNQASEADHKVSCAEICNNLKKNKALNPQDIKDIINIKENIAITSKKNNAGSKTGKFAKTKEELHQEVEQGYVVDKKGRKTQLSEEDKQVRKNMIEQIKQAQSAIDKETNSKVIDNIVGNKDVQKRLSKDAGTAAAHQSIGELIIFLIKPLYYELNDCFKNGIERGVTANNFKSALKTRIERMKIHILNKASSLLKDGLFSFFKNFLSMLLEGIVNCFVGIFKQIARVIKEGIKILFQIIPVLKDKSKSASEKGDAILKLIASSATIFAGIGIETWLNSIGIGEPWSIILASILSAVLTSLTLYLLNKMDLFGVNRELKSKRIDEILSMKTQSHKDEIFEFLGQLS